MMFQSANSNASPLTLDEAAQEIRQAQTMPFNVDDLLAQHNIQLSDSVQNKWPKQPQMCTVNEAMENLRTNNSNNETLQEQARVCVRAYLETVKSTPEWITQASEKIREVEQVRETLAQIITDIEKSTPLKE